MHAACEAQTRDEAENKENQSLKKTFTLPLFKKKKLFRAERSPRVHFATKGFSAEGETSDSTSNEPARITSLLVLGHCLERSLRQGLRREELSKRLGVTKTRITQLTNLTFLAPDIQKELLELRAIDGAEPLGEKHIRPLTQSLLWSEQRAIWEKVKSAQDKQ